MDEFEALYERVRQAEQAPRQFCLKLFPPTQEEIEQAELEHRFESGEE